MGKCIFRKRAQAIFTSKMQRHRQVRSGFNPNGARVALQAYLVIEPHEDEARIPA
jgi:hypothetical protein